MTSCRLTSQERHACNYNIVVWPGPQGGYGEGRFQWGASVFVRRANERATGRCAVTDKVIAQALGGDEELGWQERALCAQTDPESFFPEKGGPTREAKKVCLACEVHSDCLEYALANDERFGIWSGLSDPERRRPKKPAGRAPSSPPTPRNPRHP